MKYLGLVLFLYSIQAAVCCAYHIADPTTKFPTSVWKFIKLTFLPYVIWAVRTDNLETW